MKYITTYKLFESQERGPYNVIPRNVQIDITDISSDIIDDGYKIIPKWTSPGDKDKETTPFYIPKYPYIEIQKWEYWNPQNPDHPCGVDIPYSHIKNYVVRINNYLVGEGYKVNNYYCKRGYTEREPYDINTDGNLELPNVCGSVFPPKYIIEII